MATLTEGEIREKCEAASVEIQDYTGYLTNLGGRVPISSLLELADGKVTLIIDGKVTTFEGIVNGEIIREKRGGEGFGYDPIFFLPEYGKTSAEISPEEKNAISHRGKALRMMEEKLRGLLNA